ncbi:MAG: hypothetical protein K1X66_06640 [Verrucomicrobiae bacterium]|nr:hypothetical protein [Verrucomicrobiae bacterium]
MKFRLLFFLLISFLLPFFLLAEKGDVPITATDTSSDAGTRESTKTLKMVYKGESRTAKLEIADSGYEENEPHWYGDGVDGSPGSLIATFEGSSSTTAMIHSDDPPRDGEVNIELVPEGEKKLSLGAEIKSVKDIMDQMNLYSIERYKKKIVELSGDIEISRKKVDYYDNGEKIGDFVKLEGCITFHIIGQKTGELLKWPTPIPTVYFVIEAEFGGLNSVICLNGEYDESKMNPWLHPVNASLQANTSISLAVEFQFDPLKIVQLDAGVKGSASMEATGNYWSEPSSKIIWGQTKASMQNLCGEVFAKLKILETKEIKFTFWNDCIDDFYPHWDSGKMIVYSFN